MSQVDESCNNCGSCCYAGRDGFKIKCQHLKFSDVGKSYCEVYDTRLGRLVGIVRGKKYYCCMRRQSPFNYPGCPQNMGEI